ncbi:cation transporter [Synechococcus sp. BSA11S]|nr:cation transporter [Synechococcus sp. BSA11S]
MRTATGLNLLMGVAGILASWWTQAQALALDGLVSGLNAMAIIVAARLSGSLGRPQDRRYPFGYWSLETIYLGGRSLMLLGIIAFAAISSIERILSYMINADGAVPPRFDLIVPYSVLRADGGSLSCDGRHPPSQLAARRPAESVASD